VTRRGRAPGIRNVTRDPLELTPPVADPEIRQVLSTRTGLLHDAPALIGRLRWADHVRLRAQILEAMRDGTPRLLCALCGTPVYFASSPDKRVFFRHQREDGRCTAVTRQGLTQDDLREMIYRGRQESRQHRETKQLIAAGLEADPDFSGVAVEASWRAADGLSRRRPDVAATWRGGLRVAFEAQLTTTFLDVVVRRRTFYRGEGGLLVWVLRRFDPSDRRMTEDDLLFSNNSNVLVVDSATAAASREAGRFMVRVHHRTMSPAGEHGWTDALVPFADLVLDQPGQRAFLYDYEAAERRAAEEARRRAEAVERARAEEEARQREARRERLRRRVLAFFADRDARTNDVWQHLRGALQDEGVPTPGIAGEVWCIEGLVCGLASGEAGAVVGLGYTRLVEVANYIYDHHRGAVCAFLALVEAGGHRAALAAARDPARWAAREREVTAAREGGDPSTRLPRDTRPLAAFLFPALRRPSRGEHVADAADAG
jgi:hypothetical protein